MPSFNTFDGQTLQLGKEGMYLPEDEKAFILMLDKQFRAADLNNKQQVSVLAHNVNTIADILKLGRIPEDGIIDEEVGQAFQYFADNRDLFIKHGITEHLNAKKLEQMTASVYTEAEAANVPTIEDMKKLEVDIGQLYTDEGTRQV